MPNDISAQKTDNVEVDTTETTTLDEDVAIAGDDKETVGEFTDTDQETGNKTEEGEDGKKEKTKQTKEQNKVFAEKRRNEKAIQEEAELKFLKEYVGENPFTHEPINTLRDAKVYKTMKQIEKDGGDPIQDYHKYAGREEQKAIETEKEREEKIRADVDSFRKAHPDVDLHELQKDEEFKAFSNKLLGKVAMTDIYDSYISLKGEVSAKATETAKEDLAKKMAKDNTSAGNLAATGAVDAPKYTLKQLEKMSPAEIDADWKNVEASYDYWQKHKK